MYVVKPVPHKSPGHNSFNLRNAIVESVYHDPQYLVVANILSFSQFVFISNLFFFELYIFW